MKTIKTTFAIFTILIFGIACSSDSSSGDNPLLQPQPTAADFLMAKVNGTPYNANGFQVTASRKSNGGVQIFSTLGTGTQFQIHVDNVAAVGSYPTTSTAGNPFSRMAVVTGSPAVLYEAGECGTSGLLTITSISATAISGTFSFTGTTIGSTCPRPTVTITEGSFTTPL